MKKLLLVIALLTLIVSSLYYKDTDNMPSPIKVKAESEVLIEEEIVNVFSNSNDEINNSMEINESEEKVFSLSIKGDLNTTKETFITLRAELKNPPLTEGYSYRWYENGEIIELGEVLTKAFPKGDHEISLVALGSNGTRTEARVTVSAYDYYSVSRLHYDVHYGELLYIEKHIMNHRRQNLLYDDGTHAKELSAYDDRGNLTEYMVEYYNDSSKNRKMCYSYDENSNRLTSQTFNANGESIYYVLNTYDDNNTLVGRKFGTNKDNLKEDIYAYGEIVYYPDPYVTAVEVKEPEDIVELNDNGQLTYEKRHYGDFTVINKMEYGENNQITRTERLSESAYDSRLQIVNYDSKGNSVKREHHHKQADGNSCHYTTATTYLSTRQIESEVNTFLGGTCTHIDEVKRTFIRDEEGTVIKVKADVEDAGGFNTLEVIKAYTNELDI